MSDFDTTPPGPNDKPAAFCQNCGKPLGKDTMRVVGASVYCEPCLDARLNGQPAAPGYTPVDAGTPPVAGAAWAAATPFSSSAPNPGLAFLLGLIPGVGAMYNEQYAKGLVHLIIFAFLVVLSHASGIFLLFVFGWIFYMAIEAHHTAQAKRDGLPLPNPFGLNDIGDRMGFGPGWTSPQNVANAARDAATAARDAANAAGFRPTTSPSPAGTTPPPPPQPGAWGAPVDAYQDVYSAPPPPPYTPPYTAQDWQAHTHASYSQNYPPYGTPMPPFTAPFVPPLPNRSRFPAGAVWLIALGTIFLLGTEGIFSGIRGEAIVGIGILALGATVFVRRMTAFGGRLEDTAAPDYQYRLLYALRPSVWLLLIGVLFLLDTFGILRWSHSWPLFIILAGVMMLLGRAPHYPPYPYPPDAVPPPAPASPGSDMTRLNLHPDEHNDETPKGGL